jgi:ubiquinone/menaquinone biosynthesis C-methylase UbiE
MPTPLSDDEPEQAREFFSYWVIFRKILEFNGLHHREAYAAIGQAFAGHGRPFSLLDLGVGDGEWTVGALAGKSLSHYRAVDLSATALRLVEEYAVSLRGEKSFVQADLFDYLRESSDIFDIILIGLNLHHFPQGDKRQLLPKIRQLIAPGGRLLLFEAISRPGETRGDTLLRWWEVVRVRWAALDPEELAKVRDHAFAYDYAESLETYAEMLAAAGFRESRVLFTDPDELYAVIEAKA